MTQLEELGPLVARFPSKPWPWWQSVAGVAAGAVSLLFAFDGDGHLTKVAPLLLGVAALALAVVGPPLHRRLASSVDVYEGGLRAGRPGRPRFARWGDLTRLVADYRVVHVDGKAVPAHRLTLELGGEQLVLTATSCSDVAAMIRTVEQVSGPTLQQAISSTLDAGMAITVGNHHVLAKGWMLHGNLLPWNALQQITNHGDRIVARFVAYGDVELGRYPELPAAWALLDHVVERARAGGAPARGLERDTIPIA